MVGCNLVSSAVINGFNTCIKKHPYFGHFCGYVNIPKGHILSGVTPDYIDCHGGITYAEYQVCPVEEKENDWVSPNWVIGFDCSHSCDYLPLQPNHGSSDPSNFRDEEFVINELTTITKQIIEYSLAYKLLQDAKHD
jgi:hypothetical protein